MQNQKNPFTDAEMKQYFLSLPVYIQESIQQSGVQFASLEELQGFITNLNRN